MKQKCLRVFVATPLLAAISLSAQSFGGARLIQSAEPVQPQHQYIQQAAYQPTPPAQDKKRVRRRSKKKSAAIIGGSALGGAAIGGLVGKKKGAVIGGLAGAGGGYVYDRKTQKKPIIPK